MKGKTTLALLLLTFTAIAAAQAEDTPFGLAAGDKVRLAAASAGTGRFTATVVEVQPDALLIRRKADAPPERVLLGGLRRLEVARGRRGHVKEGALIGFVPGFVIGFAAVYTLGCHEQEESGCTGSAAAWALAGGSILGGLTAVAGGLVGLAIRTDKWERVPLSGRSARVGAVVVPVRGGVAARLAVSF